MDFLAIEGRRSWLQATARDRVAGLLDTGSFAEYVGPTERVQSPHLHLFDLPSAFDDGIVIGHGLLKGVPVLVAAQEGQFMGGTFGEVSGAKIVGLLRAARDNPGLPRAVLLLLDSGGVRLQEANAGELAVAEVMRAVVEARAAGVAVIALVGGKSGAFGGAGLTAATCSRIAISEQGRIGVTGPEVIETNKGVEEFDAQDKGLVWSVVGGKNRRLIGGADAFTEDTMAGFRDVAASLLANVPAFDLKTLRREQARLVARREAFGSCEDAEAMWNVMGIADPAAIKNIDTPSFISIVDEKDIDHDAR